MFRVEPHQLLYIYAGLGIAVVFLAAVWHMRRRTWKERVAMREMMKCGMCAFQFHNAKRLVHPRCPNCGALVERKRFSSL